MEEINNNINNEPITPVTENNQTPPKQNNIFKLLFIITLIVLMGVVVVSFSFFKKSQTTNEVGNANISSSETKTEPKNPSTDTIANTTEENKTYEAISIQDDTDSISRLVLKDNQGNETIIDEKAYWEVGKSGMIAKPSYNNFVFSPNNNFISYIAHNGYEGGTSFLYDIKNKQKIDHLGSYIYPNTGFTSDSKFFYGCGLAGMVSGGIIIMDVVEDRTVYEAKGSFKCEYNKNSKEIIFFEYDDSGRAGTEEKVINKYSFSEETEIPSLI